jgi:hypothetical protein
MTKTGRARAVVLASAGAALASLAQAALIGTGISHTYPHINGVVKPGEADEIAQTFVAPLKKPLTLRIHPLSDAREVIRIGRWMQERCPALLIKEACVGSCARALLPSGGAIRVLPGTVIAFGGMDGLGATIKDQLDAGDLFNDDGRSQASRERFLSKFKPLIEQSVTSRELQAQLTPLPENARAFIDAVAGGWRIVDVSFSDDDFRFGLKSGSHRCLWWLPDAEGLRRLGLDIRSYQPTSRADAAKLLKVPEQFIYAGPLLETLPNGPLCNGAQGNTNLPMRP